MADVDIDPFGEHESRPEEPTNEHIPLDPVTPGRSFWDLRGSRALCLWGAPRIRAQGNQHVDRKHRSEEESLKEPN